VESHAGQDGRCWGAGVSREQRGKPFCSGKSILKEEDTRKDGPEFECGWEGMGKSCASNHGRERHYQKLKQSVQ